MLCDFCGEEGQCEPDSCFYEEGDFYGPDEFGDFQEFGLAGESDLFWG